MQWSQEALSLKVLVIREEVILLGKSQRKEREVYLDS